MEMRSLVTSFFLIALFMIALISFGVNIGTDNNANNTIDDDPRISGMYSDINSTINSFESDRDSSESSFFTNETGTGGIVGTISDFFIDSLLFIGKTLAGIVSGVYNVTFEPLLKLVGIQGRAAVVVGMIISSILTFTLILMAWRLYRTGQ